MASALLLYEPLDVIGNGSFGIIRKVRRKSDGQIFARKELNFERMSERDRKQIVAEVNILKDLHHEHIVRYHDRHVDREAGILYIIMEYCGGGDLSSVIKQAQRYGRTIPEDTIWSYFMQILLALNHCHNPNGHARTPSMGGAGPDEVKEKRPQILHRDLKPDNVFLDENNCVKLGDFGLSKALAQATFANTYVGTPYYMSPELMQEKAYDSKSDIWSLGCVIYELCALKPPFAEAKTHSELSILIRNGRIPPLPKCYSTTLSNTIRSMLNINPAMRPSAAQLLATERIEHAFKVAETQKMLNVVKAHKSTLNARERDLVARETLLAEREAQLTSTLASKDAEIASLRSLLSTAESTHQTRVREALLAREEELRQIVLKKEAELQERLAKREQEVMDAVNKRELEVSRSWAEWEMRVRGEMTRAVEERLSWVQARAEEVENEKRRLEGVKFELEEKMRLFEMQQQQLQQQQFQQQQQQQQQLQQRGVSSSVSASAVNDFGMPKKTPLEEVKNILAPLAKLTEPTTYTTYPHETPIRPPKSSKGPFETPRPFPSSFPSASSFPSSNLPPPSAMKGVILTHTGEALPTPSPAEFAKLFMETPKVSLNFAQIFEDDSDVEEERGEGGVEVEGEVFVEDEAEGGNGEGEEQEQGQQEEEEGYESDTRPSSRYSSNATSNASSSSSGSSANRTTTASTATTTASTTTTTTTRSTREVLREDDDSLEATPTQPKSKPNSTRPTRLRRPSIRGSGGLAPPLPPPALQRKTSANSVSAAGGKTKVKAGSKTSGSEKSGAERGSSGERRAERGTMRGTETGTGRSKSKPRAASPVKRLVRRPSLSGEKPSALPSHRDRDRDTNNTNNTRETTQTQTQTQTGGKDVPEYDLSDEENLPSPFLKRVDRERISRTVSVPVTGTLTSNSNANGNGNGATASAVGTVRAPRKSGNTLRALAVVNAANAANANGNTNSGGGTISISKGSGGGVVGVKASTVSVVSSNARGGITRSASSANVRSALVKAQKASEEARKALLRS